MKLSVLQGHGDIDNRKAERPRLQGFAGAGLDGGDILLRDGTAVDGVGKPEAVTPALRFDVDMYVGELAMAAGLFLVAGVGADRFPDGFAVGDLGCSGNDRQAAAVGEFFKREPEMHVALSEQHVFPRGLVMLRRKRGVFIKDFLQIGRQLDVVGPAFGPDRQTVERCGCRTGAGQNRIRTQQIARDDVIHLAEPDDVAGFGGIDPLGTGTEDPVQSGRPDAAQRIAIRYASPHQPSVRQFTSMSCMHGLENPYPDVVRRVDAQPRSRFGYIGGFVA